MPHICEFLKLSSVVDFQFNYTMVRENSLYNFNPLNLLKFALWATLSIFENVLCALQGNVYSAAVGWSV